MFIHEKIYEKAIYSAKKLEITDVRVGLGYTLVELEDGKCGISYSFTKELNAQSCTALEYAGEMIGKKASYLLDKIFSYNLFDSALAIACANAILNNEKDSIDYDIIESIDSETGVVMIGYFGPIVPIIEKRAKKFVICERNPRNGAYPDYAEYFELKKCDIAIISATTLINKTIDNILEMTKAEVVAILGPSCLMDREIFESSSVSHLCGSYITDIGMAKKIISQGGGTQKLKIATKKGCVVC
jgi:uncharacterized protein (DUF4213/DUF364 family)